MIDLRALSDPELEIIGPLFEQVFGHPISAAMLHWKYAQGRGESWTAWENSTLLMHCGAMFRTVLLQGQAVRAAQLMDSMATPKMATLRREGSPFALLIRHLIAQRLPSPDSPLRLVYGLPSGRAYRLHESLGLGQSAGAMVNLMFSPATDTGVRWSAINPADPSWLGAAQRSWQGMAADLRHLCVCEREPNYLKQRFLLHPERPYTLLLVQSRWLRRLCGLAVLRSSGNTAELLDVIAPLQQQAAVLAGVRAWMARSGHQSTSFLVSPPLAAHLGALAERCEPTQFRLIVSALLPEPVLAQLRDSWWFTGGDTEYR